MSSLADMIRTSTVSAGTTSAVLPPADSLIVTLVATALEEAALAQGVLLPDPWPRDEPPCTIVVPNADWISPLTTAIDARRGNVWGCTGKTGKAMSELEVLLCIEQGGGVWIAQQPSQIPELVRRTAERVVTVPPLTSSAIARTIATVTGSTIDIADSDWAGLTLSLVAVAIRNGSTPEQCRERLRRWAAIVARDNAVVAAPHPRPTLPLEGPAALWADETVALLSGLKAGTVPPGLLRHAMLIGPPGCGKTSIVHEVGRMATVPVELVSVASLFGTSSGYLDGVVKAMLAFFTRLRSHQGPVIGVIEEIDALHSRFVEGDHNSGYWASLITSVLLAIDDLNECRAPILLVGCTNRPAAVDPALRRPGRIGRVVEMGPPQSVEAVAAVTRFHLGADLPNAPLTEMCRSWLGETHAQLAERVVAARIRAVIGQRDLDLTDLQPEGLDDNPNMIVALRQIAHHEAAHAVLALNLGRTVESVTLAVADGSLTGVTHLVPRASGATLEQRLDDIAIALAGRCADQIISARADDGASSDLIQASLSLAGLYLGTGLAHSLLSLPADAVGYRLSIDPALQARVEAGLQEQGSRTAALVRRHRATIMVLADALSVHRSLDSSDVLAIVKRATS